MATQIDRSAVTKVAKILAGKSPRWLSVVLVRHANPEMELQEIGELVGLSPKTCQEQVCRILKKPECVEALALLKEEVIANAAITRDEWSRMQLKVAKACIQEEEIEDSEGKNIKVFDTN